MPFPLPESNPEALGLDPRPLARLCAVIEQHIAEGRHPGAQVAVARHGKLALFRSFGKARVAPQGARGNASPDVAADDRTLFLMYSNTKVVTAAAVWTLVEDGKLRFNDPIAQHIPEFAAHGKGGITVLQLLTHQGGFPSAVVPAEIMLDHAAVRRTVCNFTLEWTPGSKVQYHPAAAHWVAAMLIEALTGQDFRDYIRSRILAPLGLENDVFVGLPESEHGRAADIYDPPQDGAFVPRAGENHPQHHIAGIPGGGGYGTARGMAAFYQALGAGGALGGVRILAPRTLEYVTRNFTGERIDEYMGLPMHRGIGPHSRGEWPVARGLGAIAHPRTFGHGGVGSSYCWADPTSGVSFAFFSNCRQGNEWHEARMDVLSNLAHMAILPG
ncbi:beta-lactamase family protein [Siccirubricoccus sp. KC 17139]|uniref:Beta-lactamase family protein n=1 Tax=Siccirubricoccus soli TaxID=2899147 RepID=A0ABT1DBV1_9PROT|nr:serine hydrolase domain-containing protein [Siccirubricoccus soli]MCO6419416.1 beta-lactamase family protein [Siccirubricoccus soli]MCP2685551.1 beta-lactamase family protein [Siccirubricoccus soli]